MQAVVQVGFIDRRCTGGNQSGVGALPHEYTLPAIDGLQANAFDFAARACTGGDDYVGQCRDQLIAAAAVARCCVIVGAERGDGEAGTQVEVGAAGSETEGIAVGSRPEGCEQPPVEDDRTPGAAGAHRDSGDPVRRFHPAGYHGEALPGGVPGDLDGCGHGSFRDCARTENCQRRRGERARVSV